VGVHNGYSSTLDENIGTIISEEILNSFILPTLEKYRLESVEPALQKILIE